MVVSITFVIILLTSIALVIAKPPQLFGVGDRIEIIYNHQHHPRTTMTILENGQFVIDKETKREGVLRTPSAIRGTYTVLSTEGESLICLNYRGESSARNCFRLIPNGQGVYDAIDTGYRGAGNRNPGAISIQAKQFRVNRGEASSSGSDDIDLTLRLGTGPN